MFDISKSIKLSITNYSKENIKAAEQACIEARHFIKLASSSENNEKFISAAIGSYLESIELYSGLTEPYIGIAYLAINMEKNDEAINLLKKALEIDPLNSNAKIMLDKIKNKQISSAINKEATKYLKYESKPKMKVQKDFLSKLSDIFSIKPKKEKKVLTNDFASLLNETKKIMYTKPN